MVSVFPGNALVVLGQLSDLCQHLVGTRSAWTGSVDTWSAAVWREPEWLLSSSEINLLPPCLSSPPSSPRRLNFSPLSSLLYLSPFHPCRELQTQALLRGATTPVWRKKRTSSSSSRSSASSLLNRLLSREDSRGKLKETCKIS